MIALLVASLLTSSSPDPFLPFLSKSLADGFSAGKNRSVSPARGRVIAVSDAAVLIEHAYLANERVERTRSLISGLTHVLVGEGDTVEQHQPVGEGRSSDLVIAPDLILSRTPTSLQRRKTKAFLAAHGRLVVPGREALLVMIHKGANRMRLYRSGELVEELEVAFGQEEGTKEQRGDNRTPTGTYFIVQKARGDFPGPTGAYFGGHWLRINYPNPWDAARGVARGWLSEREAEQISRSWSDRRATNERTRLGGGIGFHGWAGQWALQETEGRMSWGCIVLHNQDISRLFDSLPEKTPVILF